MVDHLIPSSGPQTSAPMTQLGRGREPREVLRDPRVVVHVVHVEHLDRCLVIVIRVGVNTRRAGSPVTPVVGVELLVDAVGQSAALVYQLQLSARLLQPDLPQCYVRISTGDIYRCKVKSKSNQTGGRMEH